MSGFNREKKIFTPIAIYWLILTTCFFTNPAASAWQAPGIRLTASSNQEQHQDIGQARAAAIAQSHYGGKVLKISRQGNTYRIKLLLPSGTVKSVYVNASTGAIQ